MIFDRDAYRRFFDGYFIRDCTIGFEDGRLGFLLFEEQEDDAHDEPFKVRLLAVKLTNPVETRFFSMSVNALGLGSDLCSAWAPDHSEFVAVGIGREAYGYKPKVHKGQESRIPFHGGEEPHPVSGLQYDSIVLRTARAGTTVFAVGAPFRVYERQGPDQWLEHTAIPLPEGLGSPDPELAKETLWRSNFHDLAGLSAQDLYVVGSGGTAWRRQGGQWRKLAFPSTLDLKTVAVAPDGTAYVTDERGHVWQGRDDIWHCVTPRWHGSYGFLDSAWCAGRLWCTGDTGGCYVLQGGTMVLAQDADRHPIPPGLEFSLVARRLDVSPDGRRLLLADLSKALEFDGERWTVLFDGEPPAEALADQAVGG